MQFSPTLAREARLKAQLSQRRAAAAIGVSAQTVLNTEQGVNDPRASTVARMALAYGVPVGALFTGSGTTKAAPSTPGSGGDGPHNTGG